jgi:hypothetical protein
MTWLTLEGTCVTIDTERYIASQPVCYDQVADIIESIRAQGIPVRARIDVTGLRIARVDILGVVRIIWKLHEETIDENLLCSIELIGASPRVLYVWNTLKTLLPEWLKGF